MRKVVSAVTGVSPTTVGTLTLSEPTATLTWTSVPFLTFVPAAGV